jgi:plasmid stability protein
MAGLAAAQFQVRVDKGALVLGFGTLPAAAQPAAVAPAQRIDTVALQAEIVRIIEEKNRKEKTEWVRTLRAEIARSNRSLTEQQRTVLQAALTGLESRMNDRLTTTARVLEEGTKQSLDSLYQAVSLDRERDNASTRALINRVALGAEARNSQTDVILDTLLQVADLRTRQ